MPKRKQAAYGRVNPDAKARLAKFFGLDSSKQAIVIPLNRKARRTHKAVNNLNYTPMPVSRPIVKGKPDAS